MRISVFLVVFLSLLTSLSARACAQPTAGQPPPLPATPDPAAQAEAPPPQPQLQLQLQPQTQTQPPNEKTRPLKPRPPQTPEEQAEELRMSKLPIINGMPYDDPSEGDIFRGYLKDTYGATGLAGTTVRALYAQARGRPEGWGDDAAGFGQRFGSQAAITVINGTVRYAMEEIFREDLRYIPCHGCTVKHKIENALLAEITARHDDDGHRFFTLTPTVADFSGPILAHTLWYPGASAGPLAGAVSARTVFATRIGTRLFQEFVLERRHRKPKDGK